MARSVVLDKEFNKRQQNVKVYLNRQVHKSFLKDVKLSLPERQNIHNKLSKNGYSSSLVRLKNYCMLTGNSRSYYRDVKLSRHKFNQMALNGLITGCTQRHGNSVMVKSKE